MWSVLGAQRELEAQISVCFRVFEDIMIFEETYFSRFFREKKSEFFRTSIFFQLRNEKNQKIYIFESQKKHTPEIDVFCNS